MTEFAFSISEAGRYELTETKKTNGSIVKINPRNVVQFPAVEAIITVND
jgi:hypothetical protein